MRRNSLAVVLLLMCVLLCSCGGENDPSKSTPTATATATETEAEMTHATTTVKSTATETATQTLAEDDLFEEEVSDAEEETPEEPSEPETTAKKATPTKAAKADSVSSSAGGYKIETIDGVTYVDGVLVANKTYSLPASYCPGYLTTACDQAYDALKAGAAEAGYSLYISSGFRDYYTQEAIYNRYVANDGQAAADRYSARPGYSEHQTGLAIDLNGVSDSFGDTATGKWVAAHCHEYGFILRYPKGKEAQTGYMYEPWHIRYVGKDVAKKIYDSGLCLEEYYGITSEYQN